MASAITGAAITSGTIAKIGGAWIRSELAADWAEIANAWRGAKFVATCFGMRRHGSGLALASVLASYRQ
jgi:hypothetical protein